MHSSTEKPLRVLFVNRMAGMQRGGGETFDLEISREVARLGCDVSFLTGKPLLRSSNRQWAIDHGQKSDKSEDTGDVDTSLAHRLLSIDYHFIRSPYLPWFPWDKVKGGWRVRVWEFRQFEKKAARWIARNADRFDVVQICELPYLVSLLKVQSAKCKLQIVIRLTAPNAHDPWGGIQLADAVIASGTSIEKVRKKLRPDVHDIPNGVDLARFLVESGNRAEDPGAEGQVRVTHGFRRTNQIPDDAPVLIYVARFQAFKNHKLLVDAFSLVAREVNNVRLVFAGSGPLQGEVEKQIKAMKLEGRILMLGEVAFGDLPDIYFSSDINVISSEYESFCFAAIEGMAAGLPVITTDCGWVPKLIGDALPPIDKQWVHGADVPGRFEIEKDGERIRRAPGGLVVSRVESESLAHAMITMIRDRKLQASCGTWNRDKAIREHGWESSAKKLLGVYESLVNMQ